MPLVRSGELMREYLKPIGIGVLGMLLGLSAWHLWIDHATFHALLNDVIRAQQAQQPKPGPPRPEAP